MTKEKKQDKISKTRNTFENKTIEEKQSISKQISESLKSTWETKTDSERKQLARKIVNNGGGWNHNTIKQTLKSKYNIINISQLKSVSEKSKETLNKNNLEKLGILWNCQLPQCSLAIGSKGSHTKPNDNFAKLLDNNDIEYNREFPINRYIYDFKVDNILIEIDPFATHNSTWGLFNKDNGLPKDYHFKKSQLARENGYRCIHVWDWDNEEKIVNLLKTRETIYARDCSIQEVNKIETIDFIERNHLQGYAKDSIRLGLYYDNKLVSIMTFGKPRYNKNYDYELIRYCSCFNVIGGAEKLFKNFLKRYNPDTIISYCDYSKFNGDTYTKLGMTFKNVKISKHWYNPETEQHILDTLLLQRGFDQLFGTNFGKGVSNKQLMLDSGFIEIYDAGQAVYEYKREE